MNKIPDVCKLYPRPRKIKGWGGTKIDERDIGEVFVWHSDQKSEDFSDEKTHYADAPNPIKMDWTAETVKLLYIAKDKKLSLHFHIKKHEIFYCVFGSLEITLVIDGKEHKFTLNQHEGLNIAPGIVHSMKGLEDNNILLEVSTHDDVGDSYRIIKGD